MNLRKFFVGRAIGFAVVVVIVLVFWYFKSGIFPAVNTPIPTLAASSSPTAGVRVFTSQELGVSFQYLDYQPGWAATHVQHIGDKIYLAVGDADITTGQFVQVFAKRADESFADSIRRQILADYPSPDCKVVVTPSNIQGGYQTAEIDYPQSTNPDDPWFANTKLCNDQYDKTNGMRYFLYDPQHPTTFAFLSIGQYAIFGHDQIPWQNTLTFLP